MRNHAGVLRILALVLVLGMLTAAFAACGAPAQDNETKGPGDETADSGEKTSETKPVEEEETREDYLASFPAGDYGNETITILCRTSKSYEVYADHTTGDIVNDAILDRNSRIQEMYNVRIDHYDVPGTWNDQSTFMSAVKNGIMGGEEPFDIVAGYLAYCATLAMQGYFLNLRNIDTIDMDKPWWTQGFVQNNTIQDCLYFGIGDISLTMWEGIYALFYNKQIAQENNVENLYDLVDAKAWTLETFMDIVNEVGADQNGDQEYTNEDLYGFLTNRHSVRTFVTSCDIPMCTRTSDGLFELTYFSDKLVELYDTIEPFINKNNSTFFSVPKDDSDVEEMVSMFMSDQALFMSETLEVGTMIRNMKSDFGVLPFPLYDESQENYKAHSYDGLSIFCIPTSSGDRTEMSARIMDALCAESSYSVVPVFYDSVMKYKVSRDMDSIRMLNLIRSCLYFDFGFVHAVPIGGLFQIFGDEIVNKNPSITSTYKSNESKYESKLQDILDAYTALAD